MKNHHLIEAFEYRGIIAEKRPLLDADGQEVSGLYNFWIVLNNPTQFNSYTTEMVKEIILAFGQASCDRSVVCVIFTAVGDKAFCSGGNTKEYAEYYAGNPPEYKQYLRLFNDMVTGILTCDKPVINRVNGLRVGGGQEIGMACDFCIAADTARFGQAGPKHGSAPDGGATDFLHLYVGLGRAMESCTLCEPWSAHAAVSLGLVNKVVPVLRNADGEYISNPFVDMTPYDEWGNPSYGAFKTGEARQQAKQTAAACTVDHALLDREVNAFAFQLAMTMPGCLIKTIESLRKKKMEHWLQNSETSRSWLALNMMTEGKAGFRAFNEGTRGNREVDFLGLRRALAKASPWNDDLIEEIMPKG